MDWVSAFNFAATLFFAGGEAIPKTAIQNLVTTAHVSTSSQWCTPATQIGPRTFVTAAHCAVLLENQPILRIQGAGVQAEASFEIITTPSLSDETIFSGPRCRAIFDGIRDGQTLTKREVLDCWANDGQADLALLVTDKDIPGRMLNVSSTTLTESERVILLGEAPTCGGDLGYYRKTSFNFLGTNSMQVVFDGAGMGVPTGDSSACGGDSGGVYYRQTANSYAELVGIHSGNTPDKSPTTFVNGKSVTLPPHLAGGTNLTSPGVRDWLQHNAISRGVQICGISVSCPGVKL